VGIESKGGMTVLSEQQSKPKKKKEVSRQKNQTHDLSLTLRDVETLVVLLQQVRVPVGQYPFKDLNQVGETINKVGLIYEQLKEVEV
jgi:hypothetical protein